MQTNLYCFRLLNFSQLQKVENRICATYCKRVRKLICKIRLGELIIVQLIWKYFYVIRN